MTAILTIVLAAGEGKRMKSSTPKVLHKIGGLPMIGHTVKTCKSSGADKIAVVVGPKHQQIEELLHTVDANIGVVTQTEQLGTGHAAKQARPYWENFEGYVFVLFADNPMIQPETIENAKQVLDKGADLVVVGYEPVSPKGYGRLIMQGDELLEIVEDKDCTAEQQKIGFCNSGIMGFKADCLRAVINKIENQNAQSEFYLTDAAAIARAQGWSVKTSKSPEDEVLGVNDRVQLAQAEQCFQSRMRKNAMLKGVTLVAPETVFFAYDTIIENDVLVEQNVVFGPGVVVKTGAVIHAFSHLEGATVGEGAQIGPYARLRPGTNMAAKSKAGNFVEVKKSDIGEGAKINHLSYIGDAQVGAGTNIGAGTITCNYDGKNKYKTTIGANSFIGSNSALVAPVTIADGAYVASGSVVTHDVEKDALAIGRSRQTNKAGYAIEIRRRWTKDES
ncbi:bifunctional UDP-N-acetylglucosamine diphosphorylase/glucosamine-1-phosphate N-acetyltransferase GlmU [Maritalea sp.]|uniref:bifunctional UDP-N-acetylglucosamine diphosphorylase/glucosamine-1-phosphate N-acetyltransferase GlmU n=1 Tax=Maritalea sp. TaxID=2003361 RepID=UPI003EF3778F